MIARFALPNDYNPQLIADVCNWLAANLVEPRTVPLYSTVVVTEDEIHYDHRDLDTPERYRTPRTTELLVPMPAELAARWRIPPVLCDRCGQDIAADKES